MKEGIKLTTVARALNSIGKKCFINYYQDFKLCTEKDVLAHKLLKAKEPLIKSGCANWRADFLPDKAKSRRNTDVFQGFLTQLGRKISRQGVRINLIRGSLILKLILSPLK